MSHSPGNWLERKSKLIPSVREQWCKTFICHSGVNHWDQQGVWGWGIIFFSFSFLRSQLASTISSSFPPTFLLTCQGENQLLEEHLVAANFPLNKRVANFPTPKMRRNRFHGSCFLPGFLGSSRHFFPSIRVFKMALRFSGGPSMAQGHYEEPIPEWDYGGPRPINSLVSSQGTRIPLFHTLQKYSLNTYTYRQ